MAEAPAGHPLRRSRPEDDPPGPEVTRLIDVVSRVAGTTSTGVTRRIDGWRERRDLAGYVEDPQWRPATDEPDSRKRHPVRTLFLLFVALALLVVALGLVGAAVLV